jgi:spermidine/putrescine transport system substrate-binding protein
MSDNESVRILASEATAKRMSRRAFMAGMSVTAVGGSIVLSACGNGSSGASATPTSGGSSSAGPIENSLFVYNWAAYDDPKLWKKFTTEMGPKVTIDIFDSNEQAIAKLNADGSGQSGYDVMCPTGVYIPLMVKQELLEQLDLSRIPNFKNINPEFTGQSWDKNNNYSVCKDWGTTGFIYDTTVIKRDLKTWADFVDAMQNEAKGNTSVLDTPANLCSLYFWTQNPPGDWTTTDAAELAKCNTYVTQQVAPNVKAYDSYPGINLVQGKYAMSMAWNGDARQGLLSVKDPSRYKWVTGTPTTELWMDNWTIVKGAPHPNAAYAWINFILDPVNSYTDVQFHGYNTGIDAVKTAAEKDKVPYLDMIYYPPEVVATWQAGSIDNVDQLTTIYQNAKAVSAG